MLWNCIECFLKPLVNKLSLEENVDSGLNVSEAK